ncbi:MAG: hypothetical protein H6659_18540 [Ardenticatenaceae bacterium]|nr:hypothetical protein [Ardenticatenaceae bacterium]
MDPLTHLVITGKVFGRDRAVLLAGVLPDAPFYLTYPGWVIVQGKLEAALKTQEWPEPPAWMEWGHHVFHSLPLVTLAAWLVYRRNGRLPRRVFGAWALHIVIDIPTHSRRHWAPRFLWPFSRLTVDGISWVELALRAVHYVRLKVGSVSSTI